MIKTDLIDLCNKQVALERRNRKARRYSAHIAKMKRKKEDLLAFCVSTIGIILISAIFIFAKSEPRYAIVSENGSSLHYIYVTERVCTVTNVNNNIVTVEYNGSLYAFVGDGCAVGEEIVCQFTDNMEIIGISE